MGNSAISVIIPLYNAENYIGECLDSLLAQTFKDFEVIVVDDCSTDDSVEIVESYKEKFNERLTISKTEENSGGAGYVPRNIGFNLASGEYIFFVDAEDYLLDSALETLYKSAKKYDAEVVYTGVRYQFDDPDEIRTVKDGEGERLIKNRREDKTTLLDDMPNESLKQLSLAGNFLEASSKFIRKDFLIKNEITFPETITGSEFLWTVNIYCHAKKFLRLITPIYFYRVRDEFVASKEQPNEEISAHVSEFIAFLKALNYIVNRNPILKENPVYSYKLLSIAFNYHFKSLSEALNNLSSQEVYENLIREFEDKSDSSELSVPFFFSQIVNRKKRMLKSPDPIVAPKVQDIALPFESETVTPDDEQHPAVSVIIPMFNVEKYIGECLESILLQTFQDFEVIVVDDCSTDSSYKVVESYIPKFDGRLKLAQTEKNSGGETMPRNIGFNIAKGEYILFVDSDDFILLTALENLYKAAKKYNADVVYTCEYYRSDKQNEVYKLLDGRGNTLSKKGIEDTTTLRINKPYENLYQLIFKNEFPNVWTKFVRREFLIENKIFSPLGLPISGDFIWVIEVFAHAKNLVRMPFPFYFYRHYRVGSVVTTKRKPEEQISHWVSAFIPWLGALSNLYKRIEMLHENPAYCYKALFNHFSWCLRCLSEELKDFSDENIYEILYKKFTKEDGSADLIVPFFFSQIVNFERLPAKLAAISSAKKHFRASKLKALVTHFPAISVIIPMYNRKKYIGECLDCLLEQTFPYFEVIVIDDCSTDNSVEIVEGYKEIFGERLKLIKLEKNTGHPGEPRNRGIAIAQGEYIYCLDSDDIITETALEEMYTLGKKFDADVVYCEKYFMSEGTGQDLKNNIRVANNRLQKPPFVDEPTLESDDLGERVKKFLNWNYWMSPALKIVKRDLLIGNDITFPSLVGSEDDVWSLKVTFCSKRFLRIPNICFIRRMHDEGISFGEYTTPDHVQRWMDVTIRSLKNVDNFLKKIDFFKENPIHRYELLERLVNASFGNAFGRLANESSFEIYNIFNEKFGDSLGEYDILITLLCTQIINQRKVLSQQKKNPADEAKQLIAEKVATINKIAKNIDSVPTLPVPSSNVPPISVIIPMYNADEYIGECLTSLLMQTFKDFEVIIVDDASTDGSVAIVEYLAEKFNGRLKFASTEKNSGGGGYIPRNIGLELAHGEYIFFLDADDIILDNTLETLYKATKDYDADVVYMSAYYDYSSNGKFVLKGVEDNTTLAIDNPSKNLNRLLFNGEARNSWTKFARREFLLKNEITFPEIMSGGDFIWTMHVYCCSKRFLRLPSPLYIYRNYSDKSILRKKKAPAEQSFYWASAFVTWAKAFNKLINENEILQKNPSYCRQALTLHFDYCLACCFEARNKLNAQELYDVLQKEFSKDYTDSALPFLLSFISEQQKKYDGDSYLIDKLSLYITARVDIKLITNMGKGGLKILSVSDNKASVSKPDWLQKDGVGYTIQSHAGKIEFVAKATTNGKINLNLRSLDIRDPADKSKRVPYWIDYTKLTVKGNTIFNKLTPAWHDKAYRYDIDVKANEAVKIQIEWLPHRGDILPPPKPVEIPKLVEKPVEFLPNLTARLEVQMVSDTGEGDFKILSVSDKIAKTIKPDYLNREGIGYQIQSYVGKMAFIAKSTTDGKVTLKLKGMNVHDPEDKSKLVPYWIDYTKLTVNGKTIIDKLTPAWHDKPYRYDMDVKANEEVKVEVEWFPHRDEVVVEVPKPVEKPVEFLPNLTARLDVQMVSDTGEGDFQILSVSDKRASVNKPGWLQKDGIGYVIQSYVGKMEFIAKATTDGKVTLKFKGMNVHDPADKSKLVPYWIDYTKLSINGKAIIDKLTPAWHDKPYRYDMDVKADEEVKVEVEWFPHRDEVVVEVPKPVEKPVEFLPNLTARLDVQMVSDTGEGDFQILSVSDKRASVNKPGWLQKDGIGYVIQSYVGKMEFIAKATTDGKVTLKFKGMNVHDPADKSKLVPYWIDYTKLSINGKAIIDKLTPAWHDKPYRYDMKVKADEEVKVEVEWFPHRDEVVVEVIKPVEKPVEFLPNLTARLDLQMVSDTVDGEFKILSISDDKAKTTKPDYLNRDGIGYVIQSFAGKMELIAKANEDGQVILKLKGMDIRDPGDKSRRLPYWIDYTKLTVDGNTIFDKITPAWHDKPYRYDIDAEADEEIKIQVEWLAHNKDT